MANHYSLCLVGAMDRLWFHQIILFPEPISLLCQTALETDKPFSKSLPYSPQSCLSLPPHHDLQHELLPDNEEISSAPSSISDPQDASNSDDEDEEKEIRQKERQSRSNPIRDRESSQYSSSTISINEKRPRSLTNSAAMRKLYKSMSCKTLGELELEEVQGFMDLGFIFKKELVSPRMMSLVPGLQRLGEYKDQEQISTKFIIDDAEVVKDDESGELGKEIKRVIKRPYLSEAWFIKRHDSPLLNVRIARASTAADMKKNIKFWARNVAISALPD
ncbi:uncharacterized protein LOC122278205 [Carya illinoinensis]|uniref:Uncharacterized protein n=1 Tax=Carya illinoinensis TaxID=32201 RepID=A0A8T1PE56_CARIL|nr:uncharacterized protein LOC122278205 [Carya illinoinensis]KAG6639911.1 hypothetical protein CIPAW_10G134900 [Carya illinoinensis]